MINQEPQTVLVVQNRFHGLDHLRAFAILFVFLFHYQGKIFGHPDWTTEAGRFGWTGVDLFFVLSGFLISSQLFEQIKQGRQIAYRDFFVKRFFRIIPAFVVVTAIYFCFPGFHEKPALAPLWRFLTFTANFGLNKEDFGTFSHSWSLCVEEQFYLFLPLTLIVFQYFNKLNKAYWLLIIFFAAGFFLRIYSWNELYLPELPRERSALYWSMYIYYPTYNRLDGLLAGVTVAIIYEFFPILWSRLAAYGNYFIVVSLVVLAIAYYMCYNRFSYFASIFGFPLVAMGYALMILAAVSPGSILYRWKSKWTAQIATLSYSIYLLHKGMIYLTQNFLSQWGIDRNSNLTLLCCLISSIAVAWLLNRVVERPFLKLRNRFLNRERVIIADRPIAVTE